MDERLFLDRVRRAVARAVPHHGALLHDHIKEMRQHNAAGEGVEDRAAPPPADPAPAHLGELLNLPAPDDQVQLRRHWVVEFGKLGGRASIAQAGKEATAELVSRVGEILARRGGACMISAHPLLAALGLERALADSGIPVEVYRTVGDRSHLAVATVGVVVASAAIAETGTFVLESHTGQGRSSSLLPPVVIAVVPPDRLYPGVAGWLANRGARYQAGEEMPSSTAFATGPSRSADIAGDLALGVHGPGEVHALLLAESP